MKKLADNLAHKIAVNQNMGKDREEVISYGMQASMQMVIIFLFALITGFIIKAPLEAVAIYLTVGIFRKFTGGAHGKSMLQCIAVSVLSITAMSFLSSSVMIDFVPTKYFILIISLSLIYSAIVTFIKAPVDSVNKPITKVEKIKRLRKASFIFISVITIIIISLCIAYLKFSNKVFLSLGYSFGFSMIWQSSTLLPKKRATAN